jgi:hypothetical protein
VHFKYNYKFQNITYQQLPLYCTNIYPSLELKENPTVVVLNALSSKGKSIVMSLKTQMNIKIALFPAILIKYLL